MTHPLAPHSTPHPAGYRDVSAKAALAHLGQVRIIDVREPDEFVGDLGHIAGAELVPLGSVAGAASRWRPDEALLVVCRSGGRSGRAAGLLAQHGYTTVFNLQGGMLGWTAEGLPVTR